MNDYLKSQIRILTYLLVSGGLGYLLATYVADDPMLTAVFAPAVNYVLFVLEKELQNEGLVRHE
jgi:hypothetical protein